MKPWQKGYELDHLIQISNQFEDFNKFSCSPFSEMSKNRVAEALEKGHIEWCEVSEGGYGGVVETCVHQSSRKSIKVDGSGLILGYKEPGDRIVKKISGDVFPLCTKLDSYKEPIWLYIWEEDVKSRNVASFAKFKKIGAKITSFGEIYGIYFRDVPGFFGEREHPFISEYEKLPMTKLKLEKTYPLETALASIKDKIETLPEFTNHYSNYNKRGSWSALSLRGYRPDPSFITKPIEMNKKWKSENEGCLEWKMEDTPLREKFSEIETLMDMLPGEKHRIRLMRLKSGGGELKRHTDQVDQEQGLANGKIARFHFPVVTNDKVIFNNWDWDGKTADVNMKVGEVWYLDVRKPHRAINGGTEDRIHIVVDVEANDELRKLI